MFVLSRMYIFLGERCKQKGSVIRNGMALEAGRMRITLLQMLVESCAYTKSITRQAFKILITMSTIIALGVFAFASKVL